MSKVGLNGVEGDKVDSPILRIGSSKGGRGASQVDAKGNATTCNEPVGHKQKEEQEEKIGGKD